MAFKALPEETKDKILKQYDNGIPVSQIARSMGLSYSTVWSVKERREQEKYKLKIEPEKKDVKPVVKIDRKKCRTCQYRGRKGVNGCNYILIEEHSRGCEVGSKCNKYKRGKQLVPARNFSLITPIYRGSIYE